MVACPQAATHPSVPPGALPRPGSTPGWVAACGTRSDEEGAPGLKPVRRIFAQFSMENCLPNNANMLNICNAQSSKQKYAVYTKNFTKPLGKSEDGLYQLLRRLRLELKSCVEKGLAAEGGVS